MRCDDVTSDESSDGELPPPANPDAPTGVNGNKTSTKADLKTRDLVGPMDIEDKGEEKKVRERASKLEFKRLDELCVSPKPPLAHHPVIKPGSHFGFVRLSSLLFFPMSTGIIRISMTFTLPNPVPSHLERMINGRNTYSSFGGASIGKTDIRKPSWT